MSAVITHRLTYNHDTDRWTCPCGYMLGDGRDKLFAKCKYKHRTLSRNQDKVAQPKFRETSKRFTPVENRHLSHRSDDLFGFASDV
jgi:hypothetical protein